MMRRKTWLVGLAILGMVCAGRYANAQSYTGTGSQKVVNSTVVRDTAVTVATTLASHLSSISGLVGGVGALALGPRPHGVSVARAGLDSETGRSGAVNPLGFGLWVNGGFTSLTNDFTQTKYDGHVANGLIGLDYKLNERITLGVAGGYENTDLNTTFNFGTFKADGYSVTPYVVVRLTRNFSVNAAGTYTWLSTDVTGLDGATPFTGSYNSTRETGTVNLLGHWEAGKWQFGTTIGYLYVHQNDNSYTQSNGSAISAETINVGQGHVGGRIGYDMGKVETYLSGRYEYDFVSPGASTIPVGAGFVTTPRDRSGFTFAAGLSFEIAPNVTGNLEGTTTQGRSNQDIYGANGTVRFQF